MTTFKLIILSIVTLIGLTGCNPNYEKFFDENKKQFDLNRTTLKKVISDIEQSTLVNWDKQNEIVFPIDSLDQQTKKTLKELGIASVELTRNPNDNCEKNYWITLNVIDGWNISNLRVVQLVYAPCDKKGSKDYHESDGYHRDFWGQGDDWFIYSDTDLI